MYKEEDCYQFIFKTHHKIGGAGRKRTSEGTSRINSLESEIEKYTLSAAPHIFLSEICVTLSFTLRGLQKSFLTREKGATDPLNTLCVLKIQNIWLNFVIF